MGFNNKPGPGRPAGTPNKTTADIKALAQSYGPAAIARLAELAGLAVDKDGKKLPGATNQGVQHSCMKELMDRGFGKATQFLASDASEGGLVVKVVKFTPE